MLSGELSKEDRFHLSLSTWFRCCTKMLPAKSCTRAPSATPSLPALVLNRGACCRLFFSILSLMKSVCRINNGIRWTLNSYLEDLEYADDIYLHISHTYDNILNKLNALIKEAASVGLASITKSMRIATQRNENIFINNQPINDVICFTYIYLGSIISKTGGAEKDVAARWCRGEGPNTDYSLKCDLQSLRHCEV